MKMHQKDMQMYLAKSGCTLFYACQELNWKNLMNGSDRCYKIVKLVPAGEIEKTGRNPE